MNDDLMPDDLAWLRDEQPAPLPLHAAATLQARTALLDHAAQPHAVLVPLHAATAVDPPASRSRRRARVTASADDATTTPHRRGPDRPVGITATADDATAAPGRRGPDRPVGVTATADDATGTPGRRRPFHPARVAAMAVVSVAAAIVLVVTLTISPHTPGVSRPPAAAASPLARLAARVVQSPKPAGDATLVLRTQTYPDRSTITGADLYADNGDYFYSETKAGLPGVIARHESQDNEYLREEAAAVAALTLPTDRARADMAASALDPNPPTTTPAEAAANEQMMRQKQAIAEAETGTSLQRSDPTTLLEGNIWSNSLDALTAGGGRRDVRAGVLKLLSTISRVTVVPSTWAGRPVLVLTSHVFPDGYTEQLTIDADTGMLVRFVGATAGQAPSVTVAYSDTRVTVASVAAGH